MDKSTPSAPIVESEEVNSKADSLLLQIRSDRRLGHEWEDWDGDPLPNNGQFHGPIGLFFAMATALGLGVAGTLGLIVWLSAPRLSEIWSPLPRLVSILLLAVTILWGLWLVAVGVSVAMKTNRLPPRLAEQGLLPWVMPKIERGASFVGMSRDVIGNSMLRVFDRLAIARSRSAVDPSDLLILIPRCLGKEAMRCAMAISSRYEVPMFVAARGRYARQMIGMRRPKAVVAVACERDLVSGMGDVGGRLPVMGTTLTLPEGPCRGTEFDISSLENQVRALLGLTAQEA